jgi:hypothetical protein
MFADAEKSDHLAMRTLADDEIDSVNGGFLALLAIGAVIVGGTALLVYAAVKGGDEMAEDAKKKTASHAGQ